jgi:hypothetical protein
MGSSESLIAQGIEDLAIKDSPAGKSYSLSAKLLQTSQTSVDAGLYWKR